MMLCAALCFSIGGLLLKYIPWSALAINGARNVVAAVVIGIYLIVTRHRLKFNFTVAVGAICLFGVTTLFSMANKMTTAGNAIVLQYTAPVWIIILMALFFRKKPAKLEIITIIIVIVGIAFFLFDSLGNGHMIGDILALISGIFYAGVFMLNSFEKGDALSSIFFGQVLSAVTLTPLVAGETDFSANVVAAVFILGAVQVGLAYIFFNQGTKYTGPVTASIINAIEPILNPVWVAIFIGEVLTPFSLVGAGIVVAAIVVYNIKSIREAGK